MTIKFAKNKIVRLKLGKPATLDKDRNATDTVQIVLLPELC